MFGWSFNDRFRKTKFCPMACYGKIGDIRFVPSRLEDTSTRLHYANRNKMLGIYHQYPLAPLGHHSHDVSLSGKGTTSGGKQRKRSMVLKGGQELISLLGSN